MQIVWKHPDTTVPSEYESLPRCDDESQPKNVFVVLDPEQWVEFINGEEWCFAEDAQGNIIHALLAECQVPTEQSA